MILPYANPRVELASTAVGVHTMYAHMRICIGCVCIGCVCIGCVYLAACAVGVVGYSAVGQVMSCGGGGLVWVTAGVWVRARKPL